MGVKQCEEPLSKKEEKPKENDDQEQGLEQEQQQEQTLAEEKEDVSSCIGDEEGTQEEAEIELDRWGMRESSKYLFTPLTIVTDN